MNILIIYCHPSQKSYTFQILKNLKEKLLHENHNIEITDLYAMNFQSDMTENEYEREGFGIIEFPISTDVLFEHKKIEKADCIIFLYPVWWSDCPVKLKGWFDRVYSVGYAYGQKEGVPIMKTIKLGLVICTAGHSNDFLNEIGIAQSMQTVMLDDRLGKRFKNKEMLILGGTTLMNDNLKQIHQNQIDKIIQKINF